ncbi:MAG: DUF4116 domain-containing protein [Clostridia bacterium]|nr:DUF4116 domain-containing protein [Clostridiaceae bacterium]HJJ14666.1 DUF4116 domain-containing protein [Clostridiaceae bacterium]
MSLTIFNSIEKLKQDTTCLQYLNKDQKNFILNNKDIILDIIKHNVNIIKYISSDMIDKDIMLAAVANTPNALMFANDSFLDDEDIILEAIKKEAKSLLFASDNLKAKKSFLLKVVKINKDCYKYLDKKFKDDEDFLTLINYDENLINLYGNPKKQVESIIFNYDRPYPFEFAMGASRSEYEYYTRSFNGDITLKDLIEEHIVFMIDGYYKMFVKEDNKETLIAEIYSVFGKNTSISLFIDNCRLENVFSNKNNIKQHSIECRVLKLTKNQLAQKGISVINTNAYLTVNRIDCLNINNILHKKGILHE